MLTNLRNGNTTLDEWNTLLTGTPQQVTNMDEFHKESVKLSFGNEKVAEDNYACLMKVGNPIALIKAKHNNPKASKLPADDMGCLEPQLLLCKGARVMLTPICGQKQDYRMVLWEQLSTSFTMTMTMTSHLHFHLQWSLNLMIITLAQATH